MDALPTSIHLTSLSTPQLQVIPALVIGETRSGYQWPPLLDFENPRSFFATFSETLQIFQT